MDVHTKVPTLYGDWVEKFGDQWSDQISKLQVKFPSAIVSIQTPQKDATDVPVLVVTKDKILAVLEFLRDDPAFDYNFLTDYTATDEENESLRFYVVYQLFSTAKKYRIRVKVGVKDGETMPTAIGLWAGANWAEREIWDMFGIRFDGHPDLRRILMDERWVGHPLRKDYPLRGYQLFQTPEPINPKLLE